MHSGKTRGGSICYPDVLAIALRDLNQCHLKTTWFELYVKDKTRKDNIEGAYVSKCRPSIINSHHNVVHMIPVYKTKLKRSRPENNLIRTWTN